MSFSIFKAARGAGISDKDAQVIGPVFEQINEVCGGSYTVEDVVERVESKDPLIEPIRPYYLEDPDEQRKAYLRTRTQELQRWLIIEVINPDEPESPIEIRGFTTATDSPPRREGPARYTSSAKMLNSRSEKKRKEFIDGQIQRITVQLARWERQLAGWTELTNVRKAIRALRQELKQSA